jgi:hypothetical protein
MTKRDVPIITDIIYQNRHMNNMSRDIIRDIIIKPKKSKYCLIKPSFSIIMKYKTIGIAARAAIRLKATHSKV